MSSSYLPAGVKVNCTYMTVNSPLQLGISRKKVTVFKGSNRAALLNIEDKKISASFQCKAPAKFLDGLAALCAGIAIGIVAVVAIAALAGATVLTGGAALIAVGVVMGLAASTMIAAPIVGMYQQSHACDCTLDKKSVWLMAHTSVNINGAKAILLQSQLSCSKKGIVQPFMDPALAQAAADKIVDNNNAEIDDQVMSEFAIGVVSMLGTLADPTAIVLTSGFAVYEYQEEYDVTEGSSLEEDYENAKNDAIRDNLKVGGAPTVGIATHDAIKEVTEYNEKMLPELMDQGASLDKAMELQAAFGKGGGDVAKGAAKGIGKSLGAGFAAAAVNFGIAQWAKNGKLGHINAVLKINALARNADSKNGIKIIAKTPTK